MSEEKIAKAQEFLRESGLDGWLLYDFHRSNDLARRFVEIPEGGLTTRRFFFWIPAEGKPVRIVHAIESHVLDRMSGEKKIYASWQILEKELKAILKGKKKVAMEYSPNNAIPYVSKVDGGTIDLVRSFGVEVVSSANFLLYFTSVLSEEQMKSQKRAAEHCRQIVDLAWKRIGSKELRNEWAVSLMIQEEFKRRKLTTEALPIVAVNRHSADPHYATEEKGSNPIREGDFLLIDLWAKEEGESTVFGDLTRVAVIGREPSAREAEVFSIVRAAQKKAIAKVKERFAKRQPIQGWEVDEEARSVIREAGFGDFFLHRTGHSIEVELHGSGTHMDNLEMHDVRPLVPMTCFSVEPGIYLSDEFGVRLESDVLIHRDGVVEVTGGEQDAIQVIRS